MKPPDEQVRRELVSQWVRKADTDLAAAESLLGPGRDLLFPSCFHSQQAVEKYLKALLVWGQVDFPKTHDLEEILDLVETVDAELARSLRDVILLTRYAVELRYPGDMPEPTRPEADDALRYARMTRDAVLRALSAA